MDVIALFRELASCKRAESFAVIKIIREVFTLRDIISVEKSRALEHILAGLIGIKYLKGLMKHLVEISLLKQKILAQLILRAEGKASGVRCMVDFFDHQQTFVIYDCPDSGACTPPHEAVENRAFTAQIASLVIQLCE